MIRKVWTREEIDILSGMYPDHFAKEIAGVLGRGVSSVYCKARQLGLECSPEKIRRSGLMSSGNPRCVACRFKKGNIPANKGRRMSPEVYAKAARTMFKKGNTPHNHREVGSERVNVDGYIEIKVAEPNKWRLKHRVVWERVNGAIPRGHNVQFRNHNPLDCRIENLYLISREDQMARKTLSMPNIPRICRRSSTSRES